MSEELKAEVTNNIFRTLQKERFEDWMNTRFASFMEGGDAMKKELGTSSLVDAEAIIKKDIQKLFNII